jgi:Transposase
MRPKLKPKPADIVSGVIHDRAERLCTARRREVVNNSAADQIVRGPRCASARSRSEARDPKRVSRRVPGEPKASASTSNRTTPHEGFNISAMDGRTKRRRKPNSPSKVMNPSEQATTDWSAHRAFGGLDWASQSHAVVIVNAQGRVVEDFQIEHSALGWKKFRERLQPHGSIPFAIETSQGAAVEQLLEAGMIVYPLNPKSAQAYRDRKAPSGVKDDHLDAWSFVASRKPRK